MDRPPAVIVFTRAPRAGSTKTRLIPALGPDGASELHRCFLLDTLHNLRDLKAEIIIAVAEADDIAPIRALLVDLCPSAGLMVQAGSDLGERLSRAVKTVLEHDYPRVVVIGTDAPDLPTTMIEQALQLSATHDLVLGPSFDGGYFLVALRTPLPELFQDIAWGTDRVLADTLVRAKQCGLSVALLDPWYDVDTPEALEHLRDQLSKKALAGEPITCLRTWDYLCDLEGQDA